MQPGTGGVQRAPQPAVPLIPGLQALLAQQAATRPGALQGVELIHSASWGSAVHQCKQWPTQEACKRCDQLLAVPSLLW